MRKYLRVYSCRRFPKQCVCKLRCFRNFSLCALCRYIRCFIILINFIRTTMCRNWKINEQSFGLLAFPAVDDALLYSARCSNNDDDRNEESEASDGRRRRVNKVQNVWRSITILMIARVVKALKLNTLQRLISPSVRFKFKWAFATLHFQLGWREN